MPLKNILKILTLFLFSISFALTGCSSSSESGDDSSGTSPNPTITLSTSISAAEIIAAAGADPGPGTVDITGFVGGDAQVGDIVSIQINSGTPTTGAVAADKSFSIEIEVLESYLSTGSFTLTATVSTTIDGKTGSATASFSYTAGTPIPTINLDSNITGDGQIDATEAAGTITITGTVGGDAQPGDTVTIVVNTKSSNGTVQSDNTFSINVNGSDLASDIDKTIEATVSTTLGSLTGTATDTESYTIISLVPTISLQASITADGIIDATEAAGTVTISGTVGGDAKAGDEVAITVNRVTNTGAVQAGNVFSIDVFGSSLVNDIDNTVDAKITSIDAFGNSSTATDSRSYQVDVSGGPTFSCSDPKEVCYDIVYVRYPAQDPTSEFVTIPQGEKPYEIASGADLMLLKPDKSQIVLVDCGVCSIMDPFISYDGKTVYYTFIEGPELESASWLYKIHLDDPSYTPIRLTFNDGFDSVQFKGNQTVSGDIKSGHDQGEYRKIRDMSPIPLADGRLLFTSNRSSLTTFHPFANAVVKGSMQLLYVMDDHDGTAVTKELANITRLETGNIHMVQHPFQLKDGRILFSTWQDAGTKQDGISFRYSMTSLFTVHPDGSNLQQFTEPHEHRKQLDHFVSQLSNTDVVWGMYYPSFDYGFGIIMRSAVDPDGPDFIRNSITQRYPHNGFLVSKREFDRKDMVTITPHSTAADVPSPNSSGKYSMPSSADNGNLLVAYSKGSVNYFDSACAKDGLCEALKSGIYMIRNADGPEGDYIFDPLDTSKLVPIKDNLAYNEIWPRAVLSYEQIHGQAVPNIINNLATSVPDDDHLVTAEATALLGTSSMYNREPLNEGNPDPFQSASGREFHDGNWTVQGAEAGVFTDDDIYAVRIITTPPIPFTQPIDKSSDAVRWNSILRHLEDDRLDKVVARFGSYHGERWEIMGEFPVKKPSVTDGHGDPDTSWQAKIPADTPTFIQTIDRKGMTLVSEITWRALKSGEQRSDCGGCHAHSIEPLDFNTTEAGLNKEIVGITGIETANENVKASLKDGIWDLTSNSIPLLNDTGVTFEPGYSYGVEFNRDIVPILDNRCVSCHKSGGTGSMFILDGSGGEDAWAVISNIDWDGDGKKDYNVPQRSRYIRMPQARQSLFVWAAWGERLDGRTNADRDFDIDYPEAHPSFTITDLEKRTIARWVDMGGPIDFPTTDGFGYTEDYQLPVVNIYTPFTGTNTSTQLKVGFADAISGINTNSILVKYFKVEGEIKTKIDGMNSSVNIEVDIAILKTLITDAEKTLSVSSTDVDNKNILVKSTGLTAGDYVITVSIQDNVGNIGLESRRFTIN